MEEESAFKRITFKAHATIFSEGDEAETAYLISEGTVLLTKGRDRLKLTTLGKGDVLGEMGLFDDRPRLVTAVAIKDTEVVEIPRTELEARLDSLDPAIRHLFRVFLGRIRAMSDEFMRRKGEEGWMPTQTPGRRRP